MANDHDTWMWERARSIVDRADRIQRRFFQLSRSSGFGPHWEPPVDVFQTDRQLWVLVALPAVQAEDIEVSMDGAELVVTGSRALPAAFRGAHVHRMEIPHGRFDRRIPLPPGRYEAGEQRLVDGCLALAFRVLT
jgi:HSP20 family protein